MHKLPKKRLREDLALYLANNAGSSSATNPINVHLPDDILDLIFSFLPIQNAVQVGVVASRFRNSWMLSRNLNFGVEFCGNRPNYLVVAIVERVMTHHVGNVIGSLRLCIDPSGAEALFDKWIKIASNKGIELLDLNFAPNGVPYKLVSQFYDVQSLKYLRLNYCELYDPIELRGLRLLKSLVLKKIIWCSSLIEEVFSHCLMLEYFELTQCIDIESLVISAEKLKFFKWLKIGFCPQMIWIKVDSPSLLSINYFGNISRFIKMETPMLTDALLHFIPSRRFTRTFHLQELVRDIANIKRAFFTTTILEGLSAKIKDGKFTDVNFLFPNLKDLHLVMETASFCNHYDILSFLIKCPSLEKLVLDITEFYFEFGPYWEMHQRPRFEQFPESLFDHLTFVKVVGFRYQRIEMDLVQYLLKKAKSLNCLMMVTPKNWPSKGYIIDPRAYLAHFNSCRSNPETKICIFDYGNDPSARPAR